MQAWIKAREANDWSVFAPKLKELVQLTRDIAAAVDPDKSVYDSALDNYEKGFTSARIDEIFTELKAGVIPLIEELKQGTRPDDAWLQGEWDTKAQVRLQRSETCACANTPEVTTPWLSKSKVCI
jgi:carboxypeptidase Taq